ncbi:MAG: hypothetical protein R3E72_02895 [Steroidobacteraceae bacterium]
MRTVNKSTLTMAAVLAASVFGLAHAVGAAAQTIDDELLHMQGEFELGNGDKELLAHHRKKESTYRICVKDVPGEVPLKVLHDGKETTIMDGKCATVIGRHIDITPAVKLGDDMVLIGRFDQLSAK